MDRFTHLVTSWHDRLRSRLVKTRSAGFSSANYMRQLSATLTETGLSVWQKLDLETYLPDDILRKVDWASMACSLECRCPFLDHKLVELVSSFPSKLVTNTRDSKHLLTHLYPEMFSPAFFKREKKGFSMPIGDWMRNQWKDSIQTSVIARNMPECFDRGILQHVWNEHQQGVEDHGDRLWTWHVLTRWNETFKPEWAT
jgi:asparagine synthase (glutamine-hydrolysing)